MTENEHRTERWPSMPDPYAATNEHTAAGRDLVAPHHPITGRYGPWCNRCGLAWPCPTRLAYLAGRADAGRTDAALQPHPTRPT